MNNLGLLLLVLLYLYWTYHHYGVRLERIDTSVGDILFDLLAIPGWLVLYLSFAGAVWVRRKLRGLPDQEAP